MRRRDLSRDAKAVYSYLTTYADPDGSNCHPKFDIICDHLHLSKRMLIRHINELAAAGVLTKEGTQRNRSYRLLSTLNGIPDVTIQPDPNGIPNVTNQEGNGVPYVTIRGRRFRRMVSRMSPVMVSRMSPMHAFIFHHTNLPERDTHAHARTREADEAGQQMPTDSSGAVKSSEGVGGEGKERRNPPVRSTPLPDGSVILDPTDLVASVARAYHWADDNLPVLIAWVETHDNKAPRAHDLRELGRLIGQFGVDRVVEGIRIMGDNGQLALKHLKTWLTEPLPITNQQPAALGFHSYSDMEELTLPRNRGQRYWQECIAYDWNGKIWFWPASTPLPDLSAEFRRVDV
jgi:hypothetical protein